MFKLKKSNNNSVNILTLCIVWSFCWIFTYSFADIILKPLNIDYQSNYFILIFYFLVMTILSIFIFKSEVLILKEVKIFNYHLMIILCLFIVLTIYFGLQIPITDGKILNIKKSGFLYPLLTYQTALSKAFDIIFQQTLILILLRNLTNFYNNKINVIKIFGTIFFIIHIPLFFTMSYTALLFIIPSMIAGFIFSYLIIYFKNGIIYSVSTHMVFYIIIGCILRSFNFDN